MHPALPLPPLASARPRAGWRRWSALAALLGAALILFAREPAHILRAELWAEDGWFWYPDAYQLGLRSLLMPMVGYFQTVSRLVGLAVQPFPLLWVPTLFALAALAAQAAPAAFLLSGRMDRAWPDWRGRLLFALAYLALPNTREVFDNLTNAQWHLAVLSFLVLTGTPPRGRAGWVFDIAVLLVSGLSGPFCLVLVPVALLRAWQERGSATRIRAALVLATAAVQAATVALTVHQRAAVALDAGPLLLARIVVQQVLFGVLFGEASMTWLREWPPWNGGVLPLLGAALGLGLGLAALLRGPALLRHAVLCAGLLLAAALIRPQIDLVKPQWPLMTIPGVGGRYWYIPMLAWLGVLFALAGGPPRWLRPVAVLLLLGLAVGVAQDFRFPERPGTEFGRKAREFAAAPPGTAVEFPVLPPGAMPMTLLKR